METTGYRFDRPADPVHLPTDEAASAHRPGLSPEQPQQLRCAQCGHPITERRWRIACDGQHEHRFTNPHGLTFRIGCFASASGCHVYGPITEDYSWFQGYAWQMADCAQCRTHLGWCYSLATRRFFGLIAARLVADDGAPAADSG